jgi:hypothetical protein
VRAGQAQVVSQKIAQQHSRLDRALMRDAVDGELDGVMVIHQNLVSKVDRSWMLEIGRWNFATSFKLPTSNF